MIKSTLVMTNDQHLSTEAVMGYIESTDKHQWTDFHLHLATCPKCRKKLTGLQRLANGFMSFVPPPMILQSQHQHIDEQVLAAFVDGALDTEQRAPVQQHIDTCDQCRHAALYYHSQQSVVLSPSPPNNAPPNTAPQRFILSLILKHWWQRLIGLANGLTNGRLANLPTMGRPTFIALSTLVLVASIGVAYQFKQTDDRLFIAGYNDVDVLLFSPAAVAPGLGFFGATEQQEQSYTGLTFEWHDAQLTLSWPPVNNATTYQIRLFDTQHLETQPTGTQEIHRFETQHLSYQLATDNFRPDKHYRWELTGTTQDNQVFFISGGFILSQQKVRGW